MKMVYNSSWGLTDDHTEYYITIEAKDISKLLLGHHYDKKTASKNDFEIASVGPYRYKFIPKIIYKSRNDSIKTSTDLYISKDNTRVYIIYDVY